MLDTVLCFYFPGNARKVSKVAYYYIIDKNNYGIYSYIIKYV